LFCIGGRTLLSKSSTPLMVKYNDVHHMHAHIHKYNRLAHKPGMEHW
jgi:hypothetical protein